MRRVHTRTMTFWAAGAVAALLGAGGAHAQDVRFEGYTNGCFHTDSGSCVPESDQASGRTDVVRQNTFVGPVTVLRYTNTDFFAEALAGGAPVQVSLGRFELGTPVAYSDFFDDNFALRVTFTDPISGSSLLHADLFGGFLLWQGGAYIDFDNTPILFGDRNQYQLRLDDLALGRGIVNDASFNLPSSAYLTGTLSAASVAPEPVSMTLLGTGLLGLGAARRRKRRLVEAA